MSAGVYVGLLALALIVIGCQNQKVMQEQSRAVGREISFSPGPPAIVYKTRVDYSDKVAIILNGDKTAVVSFPHPADFARAGGLPYPTPLAEGYLLDNQGVTAQLAFTSYTMAEYAALPEVPAPAELLARVIDKEPLLKMCNCGNRNQYKDLPAELDALIALSLKPCKTMVDNRE